MSKIYEIKFYNIKKTSRGNHVYLIFLEFNEKYQLIIPIKTDLSLLKMHVNDFFIE